MTWRDSVVALFVMVVAATGVFFFFQQELFSASPGFSLPPEVQEQIEASMDDQKVLAKVRPELETVHRNRFDDLETTLQRLRILEHNRKRLEDRYQLLMLAIFVLSVLLATSFYAWRQSRYGPRLERLREALEQLARGQGPVIVPESGRDTIGKIASMIEETSQVMGRDRRRLASLENLSHWQEAARRQAHEMKTPLTGAFLELDRVESLLDKLEPVEKESLVEATFRIRQELHRLADFTQRFTGFARLPQPSLCRLDLNQQIRDFVETFGEAWPKLRLRLFEGIEVWAMIDRDLLRQVFVNLCDNSAEAMGETEGRVEFRIRTTAQAIEVDIDDTGPGVAAEVKARLFEPYVSTRAIGAGMGLGLAISRKIMLDHGGDLEMVESTDRGTRMRLTLEKAEKS